MNVDLDIHGRLAALMATPPSRPDWPGLRARLAASHALRGEWQRMAPGRAAIASGSFDGASARILAAFGHGPALGQDGINPTGLADGKPVSDMTAAVSSTCMAGDRG
jgi:hypothetical protein